MKQILKVKDKDKYYILYINNNPPYPQDKYWLRADTDEGIGISEKRLFDLFDKFLMEEL